MVDLKPEVIGLSVLVDMLESTFEMKIYHVFQESQLNGIHVRM